MIKNQDRIIFSNIHITKTHLIIGLQKIPLTTDELYNQIISYFDKRKKSDSFKEWLCEKFNVEDLNSSHKQQYQESLIVNIKTTIYTECLRLRYCSDGNIEFYGMCGNNQIAKLSSIADNNFYAPITKFLKFDKFCKKVARDLDYRIISMSNLTIKKEIDECLEYDLIPEVGNIEVLTNSPDDLCLAYFNIDNLLSNGNTPAWDSFTRQITDDSAREVFMAYVYSIFVGSNRGRQVLYLYGAGNTGKSIVARVIYEYLSSLNSDICTTLEPSINQDKFSTSSYTNKRLVMSADNKDLNILRTNLVKNITGNDYVAVRNMGQEKEEALLYSKIIITSNFLPWCDVTKEEELSRVILIYLDPVVSVECRNAWKHETMGDWSTTLRSELESFIAKCKPYYYKMLKPDGHNLLIYDKMESILSGGDFFIRRDMKIWWEKCFIRCEENNAITVSGLSKDFNRFLADLNKSGKYDRAIRKFMVSFLRESGIQIYNLGIKNEWVIMGWKFIDRDSKVRVTINDLVNDVIHKVNNGNIILNLSNAM